MSALSPVEIPVHSPHEHCIVFLNVVSTVVSAHSRQVQGRTGGVMHSPSFDLTH